MNYSLQRDGGGNARVCWRNTVRAEPAWRPGILVVYPLLYIYSQEGAREATEGVCVCVCLCVCVCVCVNKNVREKECYEEMNERNNIYI